MHFVVYYSVLPTQGVSAISDAATPSPPSRRETARPEARVRPSDPPDVHRCKI